MERDTAEIIAEAIVSKREWGDTRSDAVAKAYFDAALACTFEALTLSEADQLEILLNRVAAR